MAEAQSCKQCGNQLAADAPQGLCPRCLMKLALPTNVQTNRPQGPAAHQPTRSGYGGLAGFTPPDPMELAEQFPQLEIVELLGQGGMGAVYKARQKQLNRLVALKILPPQIGQDPAFAERFNREARSLALLNHPNIVIVYDFGHTTQGLYYFIMEFVEGTDLRQVIAAKQLTPAKALAVVPQICEALQFAHDEGIVHRDIKPENILLDKKGRVKIADFGLARLMDQADPVFTLTHTDQRMGTPHYMAPEQVEQPHAVDHRADIYSLGVVFYEMLTGELPIGRFDLPSQKVAVDVHLDDVVLHTLEKAPDRRYQHASELKTDVQAISDGSAPSGGPPKTPMVRSDNLEAVRQRVRIPAIGLIISGAMNFLALAIVLVTVAIGRGASIFFLMLPVLTCIVGLFTIAGARRMLRLQSYGWAVTVGILAVLPVSAGFMLSVPMGIWALIVLYRRDVQQAFADRQKEAKEIKDRPPSQSANTALHEDVSSARTNRVGLVSLVTAILGCVIAAIVYFLFWMMENKLDMDPPYNLCLLIFIGLELIALVCGLAGWRCPYGKAGAGIALLLLLGALTLLPVRSTSWNRSGVSPDPIESYQTRPN